MLDVHEFFVPGTPRGKGRPRFARRGAGVRVYTDAATSSYEDLIRAHCGWKLPPLEGPVSVIVSAQFEIPKSWSKAKRECARWHVVRPDHDNIGKIVTDALNGVVWRDDAQVAFCSVSKFYAEASGVHVFVQRLT